MKQSKLFSKTTKNVPADEVVKNAQLLIRAGFVYKDMAGVYSLTPLGLRVERKIENIIRVEMNKVGGLEIAPAILQKKENWLATGRWSDEVVDNWFKTELKGGGELGLAWTQEEQYTEMMKQYISSYKDLPILAYNIGKVFRNEKRAKSGLMRGREYSWKALYSFAENKEQHQEIYQKMEQAYQNIFQKLGLGERTYQTFASGGAFSKFSHEYQTLSEAGEDLIYLNEEQKKAVNKEVLTEEVLAELNLKRDELKEVKAIETGNIFTLGTRFSEPLELKFKNREGKEEYVFMGCYGLGISRALGTIAELNNDERGLIWPETVAPFKVHLISLGVDEEAEKIYQNLQAQGIEVLWDERDKSAGIKLADADLIGIPYRAIISPRSLEAGGVEYKKRDEEKGKIISVEEFLGKFE